ncbi:MAG: DUF4296 domain-containing protein [Duncaniella sp.]|nr:DUF4296 domain-containing protein [Duncaniella sp.]MDE6582829.1 DUF4296 domain-containing protein [Duncaniella sp.]
MNRLPAYIAILLVALLTACGKTPSYVVAPDDMALLMADIHTGEAVADNSSEFRSDSLRQLLKQSILAKHGVTSEKFDTSLYWYGQHVDIYMEVNEKTIEILQNRLAEAEKIGATEATIRTAYTDADSAVVWNSPSALRLTAASPMFASTFQLRSDRGWERGDAYTLSLRQVRTDVPVSAVIAVNYDDGTTEYVDAVYRPDSEGMQQLTLYLDSARVARNVYGALSVPRLEKEEAVYVDSVTLLRTRTSTRAQYNAASQHKVRAK